MYKKLRNRLQFWTNFHEINKLGAGSPYCFLKQLAQYNQRYGRKCARKTSFSDLSLTVWGFLRKKNLKTVFGSPFLRKKRKKTYIHFCRPTPRSLKNGHPSQIIFRCYFGNFFFFEKVVKRKIFKTLMPTKKVILIFVARRPLPQNGYILPLMGFSQFSSKIRFFFRKTCFIIKHSLPNSG